jgi:hypothetical protein
VDAWPAGAPKANAFPLYVVTRDGTLCTRKGDGPEYRVVKSLRTITLAAGM